MAKGKTMVHTHPQPGDPYDRERVIATPGAAYAARTTTSTSDVDAVELAVADERLDLGAERARVAVVAVDQDERGRTLTIRPRTRSDVTSIKLLAPSIEVRRPRLPVILIVALISDSTTSRSSRIR